MQKKRHGRVCVEYVFKETVEAKVMSVTCLCSQRDKENRGTSGKITTFDHSFFLNSRDSH